MFLGWALAHIFKKACEPTLAIFSEPPAVTDTDAATAIVFVSRVLRVDASLNCACPTEVTGRSVHAVRNDLIPQPLQLVAAARLGVSGTEVIAPSYEPLAAVTNDEPSC